MNIFCRNVITILDSPDVDVKVEQVDSEGMWYTHNIVFGVLSFTVH